MQIEELKKNQQLDLCNKIKMTEEIIQKWYKYWNGNVYISFSGGKDSTVLLDIARNKFRDIEAVYIDTGLEYPEIKKFVQTKENITILKPKSDYKEVITINGYPIISKENAQKIYEIRNTKSNILRDKRLYGDNRGNGKLPNKWKYIIDTNIKVSSKCCELLKKRPVREFEKMTGKKAIVGTMASESRLRTTQCLKQGYFDYKRRPVCRPMGFWREQDIWEYINTYGINYSSIYDKGYTRTGCMFCLYGIHLEKEPNRLQKMKITHPTQYEYCINELGYGKILDILNIKY